MTYQPGGWEVGHPMQYAPLPPQRNVVGLIALITGIIGLVFACVPGALILGWILLPIAFVLGIVGVCLSNKTKGTSVAAIIVSIIGVIVGVVVFFGVVANSFSDAFDDSDLSADRPSSSGDRSGGSDSSPSTPEQGSRQDPYLIGQTVSNEEWQVTLGEPAQANSVVAAENQFNDAPGPGMEFWIVPVRATYIGNETGNTTFGITVKFVGSDNRTYEDTCGVIPNPLSDVGELYNGGVAQGNVCVAVPAGADGLWTVQTGFVGDPVFFE